MKSASKCLAHMTGCWNPEFEPSVEEIVDYLMILWRFSQFAFFGEFAFRGDLISLFTHHFTMQPPRTWSSFYNINVSSSASTYVPESPIIIIIIVDKATQNKINHLFAN